MDAAMKYEELLCQLFKCSQDEDPLKYASATVYDSSIMEIEDGKGFELRAGLFSALRKFQLTHVEGKHDNIADFVSFWEEIDYWIELCFTTKKQEDINRIVSVLDNLLFEINRKQ